MSLRFEDVSFEHFSATDQKISSSFSYCCKNHDVFFLFMYDNSKQYTATTDSYSKQIIEMLGGGGGGGLWCWYHYNMVK